MQTQTQPQRELKPTPEAEGIYRRWVAHLNEEFGRLSSVDRRSELVRDELHLIYFGRPHGGKINSTLASELAMYVAVENFDPRNATLEAEYLEGLDVAQFATRKPLIWFWQMFDRSPLGGNLWLGRRVRCMLGHHIFKHMGKGVKIESGVEFTFGYNLTIEDNCTLERGVRLNDRDELVLREGTLVRADTKMYPPMPV